MRCFDGAWLNIFMEVNHEASQTDLSHFQVVFSPAKNSGVQTHP